MQRFGINIAATKGTIGLSYMRLKVRRPVESPEGLTLKGSWNLFPKDRIGHMSLMLWRVEDPIFSVLVDGKRSGWFSMEMKRDMLPVGPVRIIGFGYGGRPIFETPEFCLQAPLISAETVVIGRRNQS